MRAALSKRRAATSERKKNTTIGLSVVAIGLAIKGKACKAHSVRNVSVIGEALVREAAKRPAVKAPRGFLDDFAPHAEKAIELGMSLRGVCEWVFKEHGVRISPAGLIAALRRHKRK